MDPGSKEAIFDQEARRARNAALLAAVHQKVAVREYHAEVREFMYAMRH
jgi:hypothetical protein